MRNWILTFFIIITNLGCYGQDLKKIGYKQLADDIFFSAQERVSYKNVHFINDLPNKGAETFITTYINSGAPWTVYGGFKRYLESKGAKKDSTGLFYSNCKSISIEDCKFDNDIRFSNINFQGSLSLINNDFPTISEDFVGLYGQVFGGAVLVDSCKFKGYFQLLVRKEMPYRFFFKFNHTETNGFQLELQKSTSQIKQSKIFENSYIQIHGESYIELDSISLGSINFALDNIKEITLSNSVISDSTHNFSMLYWNSERIALIKNKFNSNIKLSFDEAQISIIENEFYKKLALSFSTLEKTSYVNLSSIKDLDIGILSNGSYYNATTRQQVNDDVAYKAYLRINKTLYDHFKDVGDIKSANDTYVRIREIENTKLGILYDSIPSFRSFFDLNLNKLLKFYTNYGTDPAKALVISFYIIFAFGIFYFFFPSDWDITSKSKLIKNFKDFIEKNEKGYIKPFLTLTLGFLISIINATTLSLNSFTTLGFGNIPTHGLARYICILEGFLGWFLLSIFTVALINQAQF